MTSIEEFATRLAAWPERRGITPELPLEELVRQKTIIGKELNRTDIQLGWRCYLQEKLLEINSGIFHYSDQARRREEFIKKEEEEVFQQVKIEFERKRMELALDIFSTIVFSIRGNKFLFGLNNYLSTKKMIKVLSIAHLAVDCFYPTEINHCEKIEMTRRNEILPLAIEFFKKMILSSGGNKYIFPYKIPFITVGINNNITYMIKTAFELADQLTPNRPYEIPRDTSWV